jgi:hypothetical protein
MTVSGLRGLAAAAVLFGSLNSTMSAAETPDGRFAIEGAGLASCAAVAESRKERTDAYSRFVGWIEGYVTAANRYQPDTYDLAPWQTAELYGTIVEGYCQKNPQDRLFTVVQKLVIALNADRMKTPSEMVRLTAKNKAGKEIDQAIYAEVLRRAQTELKKQGLYQGEVTGQFSGDTQKAIAFYQAAVGIEDTGLPNPLTLWLLFSPKITAAPPKPTSAR